MPALHDLRQLGSRILRAIRRGTYDGSPVALSAEELFQAKALAARAEASYKRKQSRHVAPRRRPRNGGSKARRVAKTLAAMTQGKGRQGRSRNRAIPARLRGK